MPEGKQSLKEDILHALDLLSIKQVFMTAWAFILNPNHVVESNFKAEKKFTSPIQFVLVICTPLVIMLNIINPDVEHYVLSNYISDVSDPLRLWHLRNEAQMFILIEEFKLGEFGPIGYLVLYTALAVLLRVFFIDIKRPFYFFLSITFYSAGIICFLDITVTVTLYYLNLYTPGQPVIHSLFSGFILIYFVSESMHSKWYKWLQSLIAVFGFLIIVTYFAIYITDHYFRKPYRFDINVGIRRFDDLHRHDNLKKYGIDPLSFRTVKGVVIVEINALSPIDRAGIKPGDILVEIDSIKIDRGPEIWPAIDSLSHRRDSVLLKINRKGKNLHILLACRIHGLFLQSPKEIRIGFPMESNTNSGIQFTGGSQNRLAYAKFSSTRCWPLNR